MSHLMKLDIVDADGAIREAEESVALDSRADFFRKAAITGGAVALGSGVVLAGVPAFAEARPSRRQDVAILNYALTLEYLEAAFYNEALRRANLTGEVLRVGKVITAHENAHVKFLKAALGSKAVKKPKFEFGRTTSNQSNFLATAASLEDTGVTAYSGQATRIKQATVIKAAVSILTVEARHAAFVRELGGKSFAPRTFDKPASMETVLKKAGGFIK